VAAISSKNQDVDTRDAKEEIQGSEYLQKNEKRAAIMTTGMARIYRSHDVEWPDDVSPTTRAKPQSHSPTRDHKLTDYCEQGVR